MQSTTLASLLRQFRIAAGLTQEELAERAQISPAAISTYERGIRRMPHPATLVSLADALDLSGPQRAAFETATARRRERQPRSTQRLEHEITNRPELTMPAASGHTGHMLPVPALNRRIAALSFPNVPDELRRLLAHVVELEPFARCELHVFVVCSSD